MRPLRIVLLCGLTGIGAVPPSEAKSEPPDPEAQHAALRRQRDAENQRAVAAAFAALQKPAPSAAPTLTVQLGHSRAVTSLSLSADGRLLLTGSDDRTARLWAIAGGRELRRFLGQQSNVTAAALSPDGSLVATGGSDDRSVRVWDARTGAQRLVLTGHGATLGALAFLDGGKALASVDWDDVLRVWDLETGKETRRIEKAVRGLSALFSPDGKTVLTVDGADAVTLVEAVTGNVLKRLPIKESAPTFAVAADASLWVIGGRTCEPASGTCRASLWRWDAPSGEPQKLPLGDDVLIRALALSPDKQRLAVSTGAGPMGRCDDSCAVQLLELPGGRARWKVPQSEDVKELAFTPDGKTLLAGGSDGLLRDFDPESGRVRATLGGEVAPVSAVALSPDGRWLAIGTGDAAAAGRPAQTQHVVLWDLTTGREARRLALLGQAVSALSFSADSRLLAAGNRSDPEACPQCTARLWEVQSGRELQSFATDPRRGGFALSPDGRTVASSATTSDSYAIGLWDAQTGKPLQRIETGEQWAFAFAPRGAVLASVGGAGDVTLRDARTGREQRALTDASADMRPCVAFSPDGKLVAAGATSLFSSAVWDFRSGKVVSWFDGHTRDVTDIRVSSARTPRGSLVATASLDTTALLWAARTGRLQRVLAGHLGGVTAVAFSADERLVITGSLDGTARIWDTATGRPLLSLSSFRNGDWLVWSADGQRVDAGTPARSSGCHWVDGDRPVTEPQAQQRWERALTPGLLKQVLGRR